MRLIQEASREAGGGTVRVQTLNLSQAASFGLIANPFGRDCDSSLPKWPTGADCKSAGIAFAGSNPAPTTTSRPLSLGLRQRLLQVARCFLRLLSGLARHVGQLLLNLTKDVLDGLLLFGSQFRLRTQLLQFRQRSRVIGGFDCRNRLLGGGFDRGLRGSKTFLDRRRVDVAFLTA